MMELPHAFGRYTLQQKLGRGGMAEVYRATVDGPGGFSRAVAIKRILPEYGGDEWFTRMIADEARIVAKLSHPNIVQVLDTGEVDGSWFIAFELVEGTDLFQLMQRIYGRGQALPPEFACYIAAEVCAGLDHAHSRRDEHGEPLGIVHRDVSPQNVLLSWVGEVKLGDFGIARATERSSDTQAGTIKGKVYYMSPEQARGEKVDHRSDLFSAGILLYEALCTQPLYDDNDALHLLETVAAGRWSWPSDAELKIPAALRQVVTTALTADVNARYQSGKAMREAILGAMAQCGMHADRDSLGAWLRAQNAVPEDRPPEVAAGPMDKRWHSSHRVQAAVDKAALAQQVEMTQPHLTPPLRALDRRPSGERPAPDLQLPRSRPSQTLRPGHADQPGQPLQPVKPPTPRPAPAKSLTGVAKPLTSHPKPLTGHSSPSRSAQPRVQTSNLPPIAKPAPPANWQMPEPVVVPPEPEPDRSLEPASVGLLTATTFVWLVAIVLGTLAALMARE